MAAGEAIGCFGLTEPDSGSDPASMRTHARRDGGDWVLDGTKMWITNGSVADVAVVWAQTDDGVRGFVVPTDTPGFTANDIHRSCRCGRRSPPSWCSTTCASPADAVLPGVRDARPAVVPQRGPLRHPVRRDGAARACYEAALDYAGRRAVRRAHRRLPAHPAQARRDDGRGEPRGRWSRCTSGA
jgi:glutaryl-CoA dehydrogenase